MSMTMDELYVAAEQLAEQAVSDAAQVTPEALGLDERSAPALWVGEDFIACRSMSCKTMDYYAGAQYIDERDIIGLGGFVFYSAESDRVAEWLAQLDCIGD